MTIVEFLEARLAEEEAVAKAAFARLSENDPFTREWQFGESMGFGGLVNRAGTRTALSPTAESKHINRHGPVRVLQEVAAKRKLIKSIEELVQHAYGRDSAEAIESELAPLAAIYSDHPDYQKEWTL